MNRLFLTSIRPPPTLNTLMCMDPWKLYSQYSHQNTNFIESNSINKGKSFHFLPSIQWIPSKLAQDVNFSSFPRLDWYHSIIKCNMQIIAESELMIGNWNEKNLRLENEWKREIPCTEQLNLSALESARGRTFFFS